MASIGQIVDKTPGSEVLARARQRAALVPDCMVEAKRIANTVTAGWHGRRKRGIGENFWQFRPYAEGESLSRIDWRRSARDDHTYVRDREWEAAHTIWLWADMSPSMMFKSTLGSVSKESRALVLMLALAEILARSGERIGCPGIMDPVSARNAAERLADLAAFYHAFGLEVAEDAGERHDHLCLELEFMCVLAAKEAYAHEHQLDAEQLAQCRDAQKTFLREHLGRVFLDLPVEKICIEERQGEWKRKERYGERDSMLHTLRSILDG